MKEYIDSLHFSLGKKEIQSTLFKLLLLFSWSFTLLFIIYPIYLIIETIKSIISCHGD
jgi:hypothetical protein